MLQISSDFVYFHVMSVFVVVQVYYDGFPHSTSCPLSVSSSLVLILQSFPYCMLRTEKCVRVTHTSQNQSVKIRTN